MDKLKELCRHLIVLRGAINRNRDAHIDLLDYKITLIDNDIGSKTE